MRNNVYRSLLLFLSLLVFLGKGIQYALIGSLSPLVVSLLVTAIVPVSIYIGNRIGKVALRLWAAGLIIWGLTRMILSLSLIVFPRAMTENHVYEQFNWLGNLLSVGVLLAGIFFWRSSIIITAVSSKTE